MGKYDNYEDEDITVELELDDGVVTCSVVKILTVEEKDYIVLLPLDEDGEANQEGEVWFYRYITDENDPDGEPELGYIDDDEEYELVEDAFDEYLDECLFDETDEQD